MVFMELFLVFVAIILIGYLVLKKTNHKLTKTVQTKTKIVAQYKQNLQDILEQHKDNPQEQKTQKTIYLKRCNDELSRNIFFTEQESKQIIQQLANL